MTAPGLTLADRYRLDTRIAVGGVGEVWQGTDLALERRVAVKLLRPEHAHGEEGLARFRAEAHHAGSLSHPNIAHVYDFCKAAPPDPAFLVMEFVDGPSLARVLDDGPLDPLRAMNVLAQAAHGLAAAHRAGLVHRDVKPGNLLVSADGVVKITDFGIAQVLGTEPVTRTGTLIGTPAYLAPERGAGYAATPQSDLYSLGVVAHQCLTGRIPFQGAPLAVVIAHLEQPMPPLPASVPQPVASLVTELTRKDPRGRPGSAAEVAVRADYLRAELASPVPAPASTLLDGALPRPGRYRQAPLAASRPAAGHPDPAGAAARLAAGLAPAGSGAGAAFRTQVLEQLAGPWAAGGAAPGSGSASPPPAAPKAGRSRNQDRGADRYPLASAPARMGLALTAVGAAGLLGWTVLAPQGTGPAQHALSRPTATRPAPVRSSLTRPASASPPSAPSQAVPAAAVAPAQVTPSSAQPVATAMPPPGPSPSAVTPTPSASPSSVPSSSSAPSATPTPSPPSSSPADPPSATPSAMPSGTGGVSSPGGAAPTPGQSATSQWPGTPGQSASPQQPTSPPPGSPQPSDDSPPAGTPQQSAGPQPTEPSAQLLIAES